MRLLLVETGSQEREREREKDLVAVTDRNRIFLVTHFGSKMVAQGFTVDLNKPLVFQVGHLGEDYQEWVHQPIASKEGPRFFESDFWEFLTKNEWWVIPLIWLPVVCWNISVSARMGYTSPQIALMMVCGIFIWTLIEYTLHRFLFHIKTTSYWGNTLHYLIHGCHHKHPMDGLRLVFPPAATAVLCVPFWNLVKLIFTPPLTPAMFGGGLLGYVIYDVTHYYLHHGQPKSELPRNLKKYHLNHHFRIQDKGFGITSSLWDKTTTTAITTAIAHPDDDLNPRSVATVEVHLDDLSALTTTNHHLHRHHHSSPPVATVRPPIATRI
ncbi:hypothetical protein Vadar_004950 [Vaccinium darrowii]|uniref:Uncharacterized protein n=1 Tax=Vaccinium darrowii TaxID=229202 RepID=A0ACB7X7N2_9ERIC|nr:hypothetical protein Vadar_004950 [Vaccinium darrowii]